MVLDSIDYVDALAATGRLSREHVRTVQYSTVQYSTDVLKCIYFLYVSLLFFIMIINHYLLVFIYSFFITINFFNHLRGLLHNYLSFYFSYFHLFIH